MGRSYLGAVLVIGTCLSNPVGAQQTAPTISFDVASVKRSGSTHDTTQSEGVTFGRRLVPFTYSEQRFTCDQPVGRMIEEAFGLLKFQVTGPAWLSDDTFLVNATFPVATPKEKVRLMLRNLLTERFGLEFHFEQRKIPVFALVQAKGGPNLQKAEPDESKRARLGLPGTTVRASLVMTRGQFTANSLTMDVLAGNLTYPAGRPVVDMTGLHETYQVDVRWSPEPGVPETEAMLQAVQQQLGLRLEKRDEPYQVLCVDQIHRVPIEN